MRDDLSFTPHSQQPSIKEGTNTHDGSLAASHDDILLVHVSHYTKQFTLTSQQYGTNFSTHHTFKHTLYHAYHISYLLHPLKWIDPFSLIMHKYTRGAMCLHNACIPRYCFSPSFFTLSQIDLEFILSHVLTHTSIPSTDQLYRPHSRYSPVHTCSVILLYSYSHRMLSYRPLQKITLNE